jgi:hypothetical protein
MGVARTAERVQRMVDEMGWGFINFLGEILILVFLAMGFVMYASLSISLTSLPVNISCSGSCGNIVSVLFFPSSGCVSSSYSEYVCGGASFFYVAGPELGPTPTS